MKRYLTALLFLHFFMTGCQGDEEIKTQQPLSSETTIVSVEFQGCRTCHQAIRHDPNHNFPCIDCHKGDEQGHTETEAHTGLITRPSHPDNMAESCGECHPDNVNKCQTSLHFTLRNKVNKIREHFGTAEQLASLTEISSSPNPTTTYELVDDLLRRRCLRCHVFYSGDTYANTQRGTGCAACHMGFGNGELISHEMIGLPGDIQCLGCHYANFVGADYYGRYEHDFGNEYRTPFTTRQEHFRPYGVEYHELMPDIHQQRGLSCVDCHNDHQTMGSEGSNITCRACHQLPADIQTADSLPANLKIEDSKPILIARLTGKMHPLPQMTHPAHKQYGDLVSCQVCHAQWSFNDSTTHLLRSDTDDYDYWSAQLVQSSSSVEDLIEKSLTDDLEEYPPAMADVITGEMIPGMWYKGFTERRWEKILVDTDRDGVIKVFRPILDLQLSYVDNDENVIFDNIKGTGKVLLPYTPHTTGKAGVFYLERFAHLLNKENNLSSIQ